MNRTISLFYILRCWKSTQLLIYSMKCSKNSFFLISLDENWMGVDFEEFSKCQSNLANNRQTRMMSDLSLVGCYNKSSMPAHERDRIMLASAKRNLAAMSYFGLTEYQKVSGLLILSYFLHFKNRSNFSLKSTSICLNQHWYHWNRSISFKIAFFFISTLHANQLNPFFFSIYNSKPAQISQYVFEETFNLRFAIPFDQHNSTVSSSTLNHLTPRQQIKARELNALDIELYEFAKKLLFHRFEKLKAKDANFDERFSHLGLLTNRNGVTEFNWDRNIDETV